ncbi:uncharacterized protein LOC119612390 [Lucilia sericata]|uniref:uncharacterized protein LOC119612390 n=1 Tax=Lucilia sericata TaxID=13632 RepID=UPI0018A7F371|nr:uncharacterized protein LOC119612390 [Lucilia sericata]
MALAAFCICKEIDGLNKNGARRDFLTTLADTLVPPNIENRMKNPHIIKQFNTRLAMKSYFGRPLNPPVVVPSSSGADTLLKRKSCKLCTLGDEKIRRLTRFFCSKCSNPVCLQHSKSEYICFSCLPEAV